MKKIIVAVFLAAAVLMTGCQGKTEEPAQSKTEKVNQASNELREKLGDGYITPSESVKKVMAKKWNVIGTDSVYDVFFTEERLEDYVNTCEYTGYTTPYLKNELNEDNEG